MIIIIEIFSISRYLVDVLSLCLVIPNYFFPDILNLKNIYFPLGKKLFFPVRILPG